MNVCLILRRRQQEKREELLDQQGLTHCFRSCSYSALVVWGFGRASSSFSPANSIPRPIKGPFCCQQENDGGACLFCKLRRVGDGYVLGVGHHDTSLEEDQGRQDRILLLCTVEDVWIYNVVWILYIQTSSTASSSTASITPLPFLPILFVIFSLQSIILPAVQFETISVHQSC